MINQLFNEALKKRITDYLSIKIGPHTIPAPYALNAFGLALKQALKQSGITEEDGRKVYEQFKQNKVIYGQFAGKATPEEISKAANDLINEYKVALNDLSPQALTELLRLYGIGVDCSGFVFNILNYAFRRIGGEKDFMRSLSWGDPEKTTVRYAGVSVFAGDASIVIKLEESASGDLLLFKEDDYYSHMAVLYSDQELMVAQSALYLDRPGVAVSKWEVKDEMPYNTFPTLLNRTWGEQYERGELEVRRLVVPAH